MGQRRPEVAIVDDYGHHSFYVTAEIATAITANTEEGHVLNFGALPPEINSGRMYSGPGSEPMMVAAAAWDELAAELDTTASNYGSVIDELTSGPWVGPTSASMVSAVVPYVTWLSTMTSQAEQTAVQARAAAAAFETAFAMTVPPPVIAANRVLLMTLIATNFFGQNTPAIAATEAQYMEMWAQDAAAMYSYAGSSALATELTVFTSPPNTTTPDADASQFASVAQSNATPAGNVAQTTAATLSQLPQSLPQLESTIQGTWPFTLIGTTIQDFQEFGLPTPANNWLGLTPAAYTAIIKQTLQAYFGVGVGSFGFQMGQQLTFGLGTTAGGSGAWYATPQYAGLHLGALGGLGANTAGSVSANLGSSAQVGGLSVPAGWASSSGGLEASATRAVEVNALAAARPDAFGGAAGAGGAGGAGENGLLRGMPMAGAGAGRRGAVATAFTNKYGFKRSVLVRPPSAG
jgi:PPE-repeat protein